MRKALFLGVLFITLMSTFSCSKVQAGHVGIKVYLLGRDKGVSHEVLPVGKYWIGMNEDLYIFPTFKQNYVWTKSPAESSPQDESITFQTKEGMVVNADVGITYQVDPDKVNVLFQKYRRGIEEITDSFLRNQVRNSFNRFSSSMTAEEAYGVGKIRLVENVEKHIRTQLAKEGILVESIYLIGELRLPPKIQRALNSKMEATQKAEQRENEVREAYANAKKVVANARGEAEALKSKSRSITPMLIKYERIRIQEKAIEKWDGKLPNQMIPGATLPFLSLDNQKN